MEFSRKLRRSFPCNEHAPYLARRALEGLQGQLDGETLDTASLLIDELVTNRVRHWHSSTRPGIKLLLEVANSHLRAEVSAAGDRFSPLPVRESPLNERGRGLLLLERLSDKWGVESGGARVWFELHQPA